MQERREIYSGSDFAGYWYKDIRQMTTVKELLCDSTRDYPENPAFWVKKKRGAAYEAITYSSLSHDVNAIGTALMDMGLSGRRIAVMGQGCYEWIVSYLAVINGTGVVIPIDKELTGEEIDNLLVAGGADTIFCTGAECKKLAGLSSVKRLIVMEFYGDRLSPEEEITPAQIDKEYYGKLIPGVEAMTWQSLLLAGEKLMAEGDTVFSDAEIDPDAMVVILFTSGTTGNPKGVMLSHRNITSNIMDVCKIAHIHTWDKTLSLLPIHHTYECTLGMLLVLYRGASTAFCEGMKYIPQNMKEAGNTVIIVVPRVLELLENRIRKGIESSGKQKTFRRAMAASKKLKKANIDLSRRLFKSVIDELGGGLRIVITGAAAISPLTYKFFEDLGITVLQGYGMTECTPLISGTPHSAPKERYRKAGSVGTVVDKGEIKIDDPDEQGIGEILFRGPNVMMGYYNMPEETAETIDSEGWLNTGDMGFVDREGWLYLTGRAKNVIVTRTGENVYPEEVEELFLRDAYIDDCMIYPHKEGGEEIVGIQIMVDEAAIREDLGKVPEMDELQKIMEKRVREINQDLAIYKRVRYVKVREEDFVRTTTRKIKRQENM